MAAKKLMQCFRLLEVFSTANTRTIPLAKPLGDIPSTHFKSFCEVLFLLNRFLNPFLIPTYDLLVDTENNEGVGSEGMGGGTNPVLASACSACIRYFSYSENDRLLLRFGLFLAWGGVDLSSCSLDDRDVMPVDPLPCDPVDDVRA